MFDFDISHNTDNVADEPGGINATINETLISKAKEGKFAFCKLIQAHKRILFGKLSSSLTTLDKKRTWQIIHSDLVTAGYHEFITEKNWKQLRDTTWGTLRKRAAEKRDRAKQTGKDGGEAVKFSELDKLIFTILDPEMLDGTEVSESGASLTHTKKENGLVSMEQISQSKSKNDNETENKSNKSLI
ncbi:hypothetical protein Ddc_06643 [Ditylenchus destructor]|nr:hypothetical protein Ddc_06643 [Ditylenchus destructor]